MQQMEYDCSMPSEQEQFESFIFVWGERKVRFPHRVAILHLLCVCFGVVSIVVYESMSDFSTRSVSHSEQECIGPVKEWHRQMK